MRIFIFCALVTTSFNLFACKCAISKIDNLLKVDATLEGEVIFSQDNKTVVKVTDILKSNVKLTKDVIGRWLIFEGTPNIARSTCPGNNVTLNTGSKVIFFPQLKHVYPNKKSISSFQKVINHCTSFNDFFDEQSNQYKEIKNLL